MTKAQIRRQIIYKIMEINPKIKYPSAVTLVDTDFKIGKILARDLINQVAEKTIEGMAQEILKKGHHRWWLPPKPAPKQHKFFNEPIVRTTVSVEEGIWKRLKMLSIIENRTMEDVIHEALERIALEAEKQHQADMDAFELIKKRLKKKRKKS